MRWSREVSVVLLSSASTEPHRPSKANISTKWLSAEWHGRRPAGQTSLCNVSEPQQRGLKGGTVLPIPTIPPNELWYCLVTYRALVRQPVSAVDDKSFIFFGALLFFFTRLVQFRWPLFMIGWLLQPLSLIRYCWDNTGKLLLIQQAWPLIQKETNRQRKTNNLGLDYIKSQGEKKV